MSKFHTEQEEFWAGSFGNEYSDRNIGANWIAANTALFAKIFNRTRDVKTIIEFGANIGLNLRSISQILPQAGLTAVEINHGACEALRKWGGCEVHENSILEVEIGKLFDLTLIKGVLIHINPEELHKVYKSLVELSGRYVCVVEYYNPSPVGIPYRGHSDRLFKRDFAGEILDRFPELELVDYGFCYHRDPNFPQDDVTWFLMEKRRR